jgi:alpha-ketoglutarate-dependent taurine dioxygenase
MRGHVEPLTKELGKIVYNNSQDDISTLDVDEIKALFKSSGLILFRGFELDADKFRDFTTNFTDHFLLYYNIHRRYVGDGTQTVELFKKAIPFHGELAYLPRVAPTLRSPDIIWFYCVSHPPHSGETMTCDGIRVLSELSEPTRQLFMEKKLKYRLEHSAALWHSIAETREQVEEILRHIEGVKNWRFDEEDTLFWEYETFAARRTRYTDQLAFVNNIFCSGCPFEDDSAISSNVIDELYEVTERVNVPIQWQYNDLVMVDNSRCMHGRKWHDDNRLLYVRMSLANF